MKMPVKSNAMDKINSAETEIDDEKDSSQADKKRTSYVYRPLKAMVDFVAVIYKNLGYSSFHSNKAIATIHGLSPASIKQQLTSAQQYKLLEIKHGVGYKITNLFTRIYLPVNDLERMAAVVESLKSPDTYQLLFREHEYHIVPPITGLKNHFVRTLQFKEDIALSAARVFLENLSDYKLLDARGVLISDIIAKGVGNAKVIAKEEEHKEEERIEAQSQIQYATPAPLPPKEDDGLFELPIPLPNKRKAYLRYPLDNLTKKDIRVIQKALDFIASSLDDDDLA